MCIVPPLATLYVAFSKVLNAALSLLPALLSLPSYESQTSLSLEIMMSSPISMSASSSIANTLTEKALNARIRHKVTAKS